MPALPEEGFMEPQFLSSGLTRTSAHNTLALLLVREIVSLKLGAFKF